MEHELAVIRIIKEGNNYRLDLITYDEVAEELILPAGLWVDSDRFTFETLKEFLKSLDTKIKIDKEYKSTTINGTPWDSISKDDLTTLL